MLRSHSLRVALAVSAILLTAVHAQTTAPDPAVSAYLESHKQVLDLSDGGDHFDAGSLDVAGKQIILLGENHGIALSEDLDLALLRYLHKTAGVRVYLAEMSYAEGCLINRYLDGGDEQVLDYVMHQFAGSIAFTREHRAFYANVRRWNLTLPEKDRVHFAGVDIEHQMRLALHFLAGLVKPDAAPSTIVEILGKLQKNETEPSAKVNELVGELASSLAAHQDDYAALLGRRLFDFSLVVGNLQKAVEYYADHGSKASAQLREGAIYDTFRKLYPQLGGAKCYGRWGLAHVIQRRVESGEPFAAMLNRPDSLVAGKVVSIWTGYQDTEALAMPNYHVEHEGPDPVIAKLFVPFASAPLTLFRLGSAGSPFLHELPNFMEGKGVPSGYVQYVVMVKRAAASHPLEELPKPAAKNFVFADLPPVVVKAVPESGSQGVSPDLAEIRVTFSKAMRENSWSWCTASQGLAPTLSNVHFDADHRTVVAKAKLEPGKIYAIWLNSAGCSSFADPQGHTSVPYLLEFETAAR